MNKFYRKICKQLSILLVLIIIITFTSCFGFYEQNPSIPTIESVKITGDSAAELAILISWTASDKSGGYNVYRSEDGGSYTYTGSTGPEQLSYIDADEDLVLGNTYTYKVSSYNIWHTAESDKSTASMGIDFFLAPVWVSIFSNTSDSPVKIKIANSPANQLFFVYADSDGLLHVGRIMEEEDPEDEDATIFTTELLDEATFLPKVDPADPDFDILYTNNALYIGFADADQSNKLSVVKITAAAEDDELTWDSANFGTAGFTPNPVSSISLAANGGFSTERILYAGFISSGQLQIWERQDASSGQVWTDIYPDTTTGTVVKIFMDNSTLTAAYNNSSDLDIINRSSSGVWSQYDSLSLSFSPINEHFSTGISGSQLSVFSYETGDTWNIQTRDDEAWVAQDNTSEFLTVSSGVTVPFSSAVTTTNMYLLGTKTTGIELLMYNRDIEKWFSYGAPEAAGTITSPHLLVINNSYYAAWIEGTTAHISLGR
ncbi:MAG: hypothetical protein ISR78_01700 [Spirochaetia bacterium]|nr:hypothetical protein [Spirochaetia bacterium]